jgi:signal transduction histidine kinase
LEANQEKVEGPRNYKVEFTEALLYAQEEERKRIARDLHDGVGQSLLLMKRELKKNHLVTLENRSMISDTLDEVRSISTGATWTYFRDSEHF